MVAEGTAKKGASWRSPGTKYKRSKNAFAVISIAFSFEARLLEISENCVILNPCTLFSTRTLWRYRDSLLALCRYLQQFGAVGSKSERNRPLMTPTTDLGLSIRLSMFELRETGDWDIFLGPPERARAETSGADC